MFASRDVSKMRYAATHPSAILSEYSQFAVEPRGLLVVHKRRFPRQSRSTRWALSPGTILTRVRQDRRRDWHHKHLFPQCNAVHRSSCPLRSFCPPRACHNGCCRRIGQAPGICSVSTSTRADVLMMRNRSRHKTRWQLSTTSRKASLPTRHQPAR